MGPPHKLPKTVRFPKVPYKEFIGAVAESIFQFFGLVSVDFLHFGSVCLHFLSFWHSGPLFYLLGLHFGLWSIHFGILSPEGGYPLALCVLLGFWAFRGVSFCSLWLFEPSGGYPSQLRASDCGPPPQVAKNGPLSQGPIQRIYQFLGSHFGLWGFHFRISSLEGGVSFGSLWPLGLRGGYPLQLMPCWPSFSFILDCGRSVSSPHVLPQSVLLSLGAHQPPGSKRESGKSSSNMWSRGYLLRL